MCPCHADNGEFASALLVVVALLAGVVLMRQYWMKMGRGFRARGVLGLMLLVGVLGCAYHSKDDSSVKCQNPSVDVAQAPASHPGIQSPVMSESQADDDTDRNSSSSSETAHSKAAGEEIASAQDTSASSDPNAKVLAYYFHRTMRCHTCLTIEKLSKQVIEQEFAGDIAAGLLEYHAVNTDESGSRHFEHDYKLTVQSLVLVRIENGQVTEWKNLTKVWELFEDYGAFEKYVKGEVTQYLYPDDSAAGNDATNE